MTTSPLIVEITDRSGERAVTVLRPAVKFNDNDRFKRSIFSSADLNQDKLLSPKEYTRYIYLSLKAHHQDEAIAKKLVSKHIKEDK